MDYLDRVLNDAKNEFFGAILDIIASIRKHEDYGKFRHSSDPAVAEGRQTPGKTAPNGAHHDVPLTDDSLKAEDSLHKRILDANLSLVCSTDVYNLLNHMFGGAVPDLGFAHFNQLETVINWQATGALDHDEPKANEVFMIRPTFRDSHRLSVLLQTRHTSVIRVVCLPEVSEMYPEILAHMLGKNFTVCKFGANTPYTTNLVELFPCAVHAVPVDGVLSMFMSNCFADFYLHGDPTTAWFFAKALEYLEKKHLAGAIPQLVGLGVLSKYVIELLLRNRREIAASLIAEGLDRAHNETCFIPAKLLDQYHDGLMSGLAGLDSAREPAARRGAVDLGARVLLTTSAAFKSAVIIDRRVDLITPMCTNFTYEGLLDSVFGTEANEVRVDAAALDGKAVNKLDLITAFQRPRHRQDSARKAVPLTSPLYQEIRRLDFSKVGGYLHEKALRVKKGYEGGGMQTIGEMGEFVKKFKSLQQEHLTLSTHVNIMGHLNSLVKSERFQLVQNAEDCILQGNADGSKDDSRLANLSRLWSKKAGDPFVPQILDLIYWNVEVASVFRLLVLFSQTMDGLKQADFDAVRRAVALQYGFAQLRTLQKFLKSGLIRVNNATDSLRWQKMCGKFNLLVDFEAAKSDCSGIFGGYAPLSIRIAQLIGVANDCGPLSSEFALLNAQIVSTRQKSLIPHPSSPPGGASGAAKRAQEPSAAAAAEGQPQERVLLCYVGGITIGEVAALALLNAANKTQYLVLATDIVNAKELLSM